MAQVSVEKNLKPQIPKNKQFPMTKIPNSKPVLVIEYWSLGFICNLVLEIWNLCLPHH